MFQSRIFQSCRDGLPGLTSTKQRIKCLDQGHNTVTPPAVRLGLAALRSPVKQLIPCSLLPSVIVKQYIYRGSYMSAHVLLNLLNEY